MVLDMLWTSSIKQFMKQGTQFTGQRSDRGFLQEPNVQPIYCLFGWSKKSNNIILYALARLDNFWSVASICCVFAPTTLETSLPSWRKMIVGMAEMLYSRARSYIQS